MYNFKLVQLTDKIKLNREKIFDEKINEYDILCYKYYTSGKHYKICKIDGFSINQKNFNKYEDSFLYEIIVPIIKDESINTFIFYKEYLSNKFDITFKQKENIYYIQIKRQKLMKKIVESRGIEFVIHFTRIENLASILEKGIITRQELEDNKDDAIFNDEYRIDGFKNATCCSICHPNYKMFYSLREADKTQEWVVIGIKKEIIWEKDCAFCVENAASSNVTSIPIEERKGIDAFNKLFKELEEKPTRKDLGISESCPTNPQAEILVFDNINPEDIVGVVFQSKERVKEYTKIYDDMNFVYHRAFFMPRTDYKFWQG